MNCLGTPQHKNSNITSRSTSETVALLLKLPTVPPRLLSYHSWIISPPLRPSCVILLRLPAGTLRWLPQTNSRYFSINPNADYLCAGDFLEEYLKEQLHHYLLCCCFFMELCFYWSRSLHTNFILAYKLSSK